jgi:hypothetical protein
MRRTKDIHILFYAGRGRLFSYGIGPKKTPSDRLYETLVAITVVCFLFSFVVARFAHVPRIAEVMIRVAPLILAVPCIFIARRRLWKQRKKGKGAPPGRSD